MNLPAPPLTAAAAQDRPQLVDRFGRVIRYLRVSVTDRCNFRCHYCRPAQGVTLVEHDDTLTLEELARLVRLFSELGVSRVRLTGGEPLLRRNFLSLVESLGRLPGLEDLSLTTNAFLLAPLAQPLVRVGLRRVNISLDSLDPDTFARITRGGDLAAVLRGIEAALAAGMRPVKVNMVVLGGVNDHEVADLVQYAQDKGVVLRLIEAMPIGEAGQAAIGQFVPMERILAQLQERFPGAVEPAAERGDTAGGGPARYVRIAGLGANVGIITAVSQHFCDTCNRVRLTAQGELVLCLGQHDRFDLRQPLRNGASDAEMKAYISEAILAKPHRHHFGSDQPSPHDMSSLGG